MSKYLPCGVFKWLKNIDKFDIMSISEKIPIGYFLEVTHKIFDKDYAAIHEIKPVLILNKPIYIGFTVLDFSKWKMYDISYNFI